MSAMPQTPKLTIKTPMTTLMTALPSQFDEALRIPRSMGPTCLFRRVPGRAFPRSRMGTEKGVTELKKHHKVAASRSQPDREGPIEAVTGGRMAWDGFC